MNGSYKSDNEPNKSDNESSQVNAETAASPEAEAEQRQPVRELDPAAAEALQAENAGLKDKLLRTLAEMENLRRRTEREVADAKLYGVTSFARDMLTFADNLRRAIEAVPPDARESAEEPVRKLIDGLEVTERDFASRLERHGIRKLDPVGGKFDPNTQEALFEMPNDAVPDGTVAQVVEPGYMIGDRVLRPARVGVARGGPKASA